MNSEANDTEMIPALQASVSETSSNQSEDAGSSTSVSPSSGTTQQELRKKIVAIQSNSSLSPAKKAHMVQVCRFEANA